ncbi:MAG: hypothetical protein JSR39_08710 [Verrucomicrobia bacterium]|nr:hypothetical protein [Verrucomicrobiota bacterium]
MSLEIKLNTDDYASARAQLQEKPGIKESLDSKCSDVFLDVLRKIDPSIALVPTDYYGLFADSNPYKDAVDSFKEDLTKTKLFIPMVIEGYSSLHADEAPSGFFEAIVYYACMLAHFFSGGCVENHIVMLTAIRNEDGSFKLEYYDPKGRDATSSQIIRYSKNTENVENVINTVKMALGKDNVNLVFHNKGRVSADQSIFNAIDCGYLVIRRCAQIEGRKDFESKDIATIASQALALIPGNSITAPEQTASEQPETVDSSDDF